MAERGQHREAFHTMCTWSLCAIDACRASEGAQAIPSLRERARTWLHAMGWNGSEALAEKLRLIVSLMEEIESVFHRDAPTSTSQPPEMVAEVLDGPFRPTQFASPEGKPQEDALVGGRDPTFLLVDHQLEPLGQKAGNALLDSRAGAVASDEDQQSSSPGESHPRALTEPDVNLSAHPALIVQSQVEFQCAISPVGWVPDGLLGPANEPSDVDDDGVV